MTTKEINNRLKQWQLPLKNYYQKIYDKKQLVVHHTAGGSAKSAYYWFKERLNGEGTVSVPYLIERDGTIFQLFKSPMMFGYHLGENISASLNKYSIPIELVCWGGLTEDEIGKKVPEKEVIEYSTPFRGFKLFHNYSEPQLESLCGLLHVLSFATNIPLKYTYMDFFEKSKKALAGESGLFSHVSYRTDKSDCHPQIELQSMLSSL